MAASRSSIIQLDDDKDIQSELQFQDFTLGGESDSTLTTPGVYDGFKDSIDDENEDLLGTEKREGSSSFWKFSYYQSFFDVDTEQVVQRVCWSMIPLPGRATFLDRQIRPKPDLYGPFWIAATLVFSTAICANIANYLTSEGQGSKSWTYDFHKVSLAATAIYSYAFLVPLLLWAVMWYRQSINRYSIFEMLCVYGYSLSIYVPISVLWVIQVAWFQWILVIIGAALSGTVLLQTFWPIFRDDNKKIAAVVLCLILLFHTLLAVGFVTYFFRPLQENQAPITVFSSTESSLMLEKTTDKALVEASSLKSLSLLLDQSTESKENLNTANVLNDTLHVEKEHFLKNDIYKLSEHVTNRSPSKV